MCHPRILLICRSCLLRDLPLVSDLDHYARHSDGELRCPYGCGGRMFVVPA